MDPASFAEHFFGRSADDPVAARLRIAAIGANQAQSHAELREAAGDLAAAQQTVGLDRWNAFLADAAQRASDPATTAAIEKSEQPPDPRKDAITPVYPLETVLGIGAAGLAKGVAAGLRAAGGAILRQMKPGAETSENILQPGGKPIGKPGSSEKIRELPGGNTGAQTLFKRLTKGGTNITPVGHPGKLVKMPDGVIFGYRPTSKSGPPSIDVKAPGINIRKLKFPGS